MANNEKKYDLGHGLVDCFRCFDISNFSTSNDHPYCNQQRFLYT